ncbi:Small-conductance mechanosensitive channel [Hyella patelloides LEGE 07179]|uniref:Small-conductance mechanosensitive channel n=2 Tax=Hyella TaxID=945733 RepID=A0A563W3M0_9CYAN|nr:Small-conductance mechanosensitive channel [Hyella patelloides LEGE 07179]
MELLKRNKIVDKNLADVDRNRKIKLMKTCVLTIGLLATLTLVSCRKENNSALSISGPSPLASKSETESKPKLAPLCEPTDNLVAYFETKKHWINICGEGNQKFFVRQLKSDISKIIRLPAYWNEESSVFLANSGDTIYAVNGEGLKVWKDGKLVQYPINNQSGSKFNIGNFFSRLDGAKILKTIIAGIFLTTLYIYGRPYIHKLGSNGRAIAYVVGIVAWPGIVVACLAIAEIPLGLLASLTGALAFGFSFGSRQVVENAATVALNLRDDVYEVGDIIGFSGDDDFYRVAAIKTSTVKLLSLAGNAGRILNISPSVLAQKEFVNYTQDGAGTLCKWVFPISLKAQIAQPGKGDIIRMEDTLLKTAKEVQLWIIQNTKHPEAKATFAAEANKEKGRQDIPAGVFLTKVEKFIHHYAVALWIPGIEIYRVASISNELFHRAWHHAVENHNLELATPYTVDDTDMVEATQAIAQSLRESFSKVQDLNKNEHASIKV